MSKQRAKGTSAEVELLGDLRSIFGPQVERAPLKGVNDYGDFTGVPWLTECKSTVAPKFMEWARTCEKKTGPGGSWALHWHGDRRRGAGHGPYVLAPLALYKDLTLCWNAEQERAWYGTPGATAAFPYRVDL